MRIKVIVPGLEDENLRRRMDEALKKRDDIDYQCYMLLRDLVEGISWDDVCEQATELCDERREASDDFVNAAAGRAS